MKDCSIMDNIKSTDNVLIIWSSNETDAINNLTEEIKKIARSIALENSERLSMTTRPNSSFDVVISNYLPPHNIKHSDELLAKIIKLLKPKGLALLKDSSDITTQLTLNGFLNIIRSNDVYKAYKADFEVGSKTSLKLKGSKPAVWKLEDDDIASAWNAPSKDEEVIDSDTLLDEDDLKKPEKDSLKVCATTGKRKACADCSCGLAEELRGETKEAPKSSCGSCYLGDAFRCASCPYLGMPAFKPGEKVLLADLNPDL